MRRGSRLRAGRWLPATAASRWVRPQAASRPTQSSPGAKSQIREAQGRDRGIVRRSRRRVGRQRRQWRGGHAVGACSLRRAQNAKATRSQLLGGMIWGLSSALIEENVVDPRCGAFANRDLANYHVPIQADVEVAIVPEIDAQGAEIPRSPRTRCSAPADGLEGWALPRPAKGFAFGNRLLDSQGFALSGPGRSPGLTSWLAQACSRP